MKRADAWGEFSLPLFRCSPGGDRHIDLVDKITDFVTSLDGDNVTRPNDGVRMENHSTYPWGLASQVRSGLIDQVAPMTGYPGIYTFIYASGFI